MTRSSDTDKERVRVYLYVDGCRTDDGESTPHDLLVTKKRPDIVVVDDEKKMMGVLELVVSFDKELSVRQKGNKYKNLLSDHVNKYQVLFITLASSPLQVFPRQATLEAMKALHQFCREEVKFIFYALCNI